MHLTFVNSYATTFQHFVYPRFVRAKKMSLSIPSWGITLHVYQSIDIFHVNTRTSNLTVCSIIVQKQYNSALGKTEKKKCATNLVTVTVKGHSTSFKLLNCTSFTSWSSSSSTFRVKRGSKKKEEGGKQEEKRGVRGRQEGERRR